MINKKNISRDEIADTINKEFGFSRKECLDIVNDIFEIIVDGLNSYNIVKIHNFGTFKLKRKKSRVGRNPKTKKEVMIQDRNVITFKASRNLLYYINQDNSDEKIS